MNAMSPIERAVCTSCPSFALMEEIRQLHGLRKLRLRSHRPAAREIVHLDNMIHTRLVKLMAR